LILSALGTVKLKHWFPENGITDKDFFFTLNKNQKQYRLFRIGLIFLGWLRPNPIAPACSVGCLQHWRRQLPARQEVFNDNDLNFGVLAL